MSISYYKNHRTCCHRVIIMFSLHVIITGKTFSWDAYHRLDDIYQFIDGLARDHPKRIQVVNIGKSVLGKHLKVVVIKSGNKEAKKMWIDGGKAGT